MRMEAKPEPSLGPRQPLPYFRLKRLEQDGANRNKTVRELEDGVRLQVWGSGFKG